MPSCRMYLARKEALQKSSFLLRFNVISNKNHLSYCYIVLRNEKVLRLKKFEKIQKKSILTFCTVTKKSRLLVFWYKYIGNCQAVVLWFSRMWISRSHHGKRLFLLNPIVHGGGIYPAPPCQVFLITFFFTRDKSLKFSDFKFLSFRNNLAKFHLKILTCWQIVTL